jgi:hypothetical protein
MFFRFFQAFTSVWMVTGGKPECGPVPKMPRIGQFPRNKMVYGNLAMLTGEAMLSQSKQIGSEGLRLDFASWSEGR